MNPSQGMLRTTLNFCILLTITQTAHAQSYKSISIDVIDIAFDQEIDVLYEWQRGSGGKTFYVESEYDPKVNRVLSPGTSAEQSEYRDEKDYFNISDETWTNLQNKITSFLGSNNVRIKKPVVIPLNYTDVYNKLKSSEPVNFVSCE